MNELLDVPNPKNKIDNVLDAAMITSQTKLARINKDIESLKKQKKDEVYYEDFSSDGDKNSVQVVIKAIVMIINDIFNGFRSGLQMVKDSSDEIQKKDVDDKTKSIAKQLSENSQELNNVIEKAQVKTNKALEKTKEKSDNITKDKTYSGGVKKPVHKNTSKLDLGDNNSVESGESTFSKIEDMGKAGLKTGIKMGENFVNMLINMAMAASGEANILDTPIDELSPALNKKIILLAAILKEISENPATKEAVKEIAEAIAVTMVEILEEIKPEVMKVTDKAMEMLDEVGEKSVRGMVSTGLSVMQAFIAEIPYVGGIVDFLLAIGKGFNVIMETWKIFVYRGGDMTIQGANAAVNTEDTVIKGKNRIENASDSALNTIKTAIKEENDVKSNVKPDVKSTVKPTVKPDVQTGGKYIQCNKINNKIKRGGARLRKTMKIFSSTLGRLKFVPPGSKINKKTKRRKK